MTNFIRIIKNYLGEYKYSLLIILKNYFLSKLFNRKNNFKKKFISNYNKTIITKSKTHIFSGYFDINPFNINANYHLYHGINGNLKYYFRLGKIDLGIFDIINNKFIKIADSNAWSHQIGSRLDWLEFQKKEALIFLDYNKNYQTKIYDPKLKNYILNIDFPYYSHSNKDFFILGINYYHLYYFRKGYGINKKNTSNNYENGIYIYNDYDFTRELITYEKIFKVIFGSKKFYNYNHAINHLILSPDDRYLLFIYYCNNYEDSNKSNYLLLYDFQNDKLHFLKDISNPSHMCWVNNDSFTIINYEKKTVIFKEISILDNKIIIKNNFKIKDDYHLNYLSDNSYILDSYPNKDGLQSLFSKNFVSNKKNIIDMISSNIYHRGIFRTDLHNKLSIINNYISVDAAINLYRQIIIYKYD
tara:strand:+ start:3868 stop:5112 length:1245 start_codon:yes stop_codon:yes gene_type:complete